MLICKVQPKGCVSQGISTCQGCMIDVIFRNVLEIMGKDTVLVIPPGCAAQFSGTGPEASVTVAGIQGNLENSAAIASGISEGFKAQGNDHTRVVVLAGDGATVDIGIQSLSGAMERNEDILYICYDNEAYMNTGNQRSSATTLGAYTKTTPTGKKEVSKNIDFMLLHTPLAYQATASVGDIPDFKRKLAKAAEKDGPSFIHVLCPCPSGWKFPTDQTVKIGRLAVTSGFWLQFERENGRITINRKNVDFSLIPQYLSAQGRFRNIDDTIRSRIIDEAKKRYETLLRLSEIEL